jgi:hypothetical protein
MDARDVIKIGMSAERTLVVPPERTVGHFVEGRPSTSFLLVGCKDVEPGNADKFTQSAKNRLLWPGMTTNNLLRQLPRAPGRGGDRARQERLQAVGSHQHFQRRRGGAAGRGDVLAQRRGGIIRAMQ